MNLRTQVIGTCSIAFATVLADPGLAASWLPICPDMTTCATDGRPFVANGKVLLEPSNESVERSQSLPDVSALAHWVSIASLDGVDTAMHRVYLALPSNRYLGLSIFAATVYDAGGSPLYVSNQTGEDPFTLFNLNATILGPALLFKATTPTTLITGMSQFGNALISQSRDEGRTWTVQLANVRVRADEFSTVRKSDLTSLVIAPDGARVWVIPGPETPGLWSTPVLGGPSELLNFSALVRRDDGSFPHDVSQVRVIPTGVAGSGGLSVAIAADGMYTSTNGGGTWTRSAFVGVVDDMVFPDSLTPDKQVISARQGVFVSRNRGTTWTAFSDDLPADKYRLIAENGVVVAAGAGGTHVCRSFDCDGSGFGPGKTSGEIKYALVTEFYNSALGHFFITGDEDEKASVRSGGAGPGWAETGEQFRAWTMRWTQESATVCRYYGSPASGPNSHFYSASSAECRALLQLQRATPAGQPRWNLEGYAFKVGLPNASGQCETALLPVYRAYNNGFARGTDSNHRYTVNQQLLTALIAQGWRNEGVAFCVPLNSAQ